MKTFGSTEESIQRVDVVNLCSSAENVDDVQLSAFVVPLMCDPLQGQSFPWTSLTHVYLSGLKLADYCTGDDDVMFDILIGSDQYWHLVSGRVVQGEEWSNSNGDNTCLCVPSGPLHGAMQMNINEPTLSQLLSSKLL